MIRCTACGDPHPPDATRCPRTGQSVGGGPCGSRIDRYEVERLLGDGGMGAVYRARHAMLNQSVALKLLHAEFARREDMIGRFVREARAAAAVGNPHIIRVLDFGGTPDGRPFLVMELLEGEGLEALLQRERRLSPPRAVALVLQVLAGLEAAHAAGIIHRDMKPANVFVRRTPDPATPEFVTVLDFGISKITEPQGGAPQPQLTQTGTVVGTPVYMAPEQVMSPKEVDRRVDLYATGVMLYEMLAGRLPFEGSTTAELIVRACTSAPTPLSEVARDVPAGLVAVVDQAIAREPAQRFQTAAAFADALRRALHGGPSVITAPQGSGGAGWASTAVATPPTGAHPPPPMVTPPPVTAAPWGMPPSAAYAPVPAAPAAFGPPPSSGRSVTRAVLIVLGVIAGLVAMCCIGSLAVGYFATDSSPAPQPQPQPQLTPIPAPQSSLPAPGSDHAETTAPAPPVAPASAASGVVIGEPRIVGTLSALAVVAALRAAAPSFAACASSVDQDIEVLAIVDPDGDVTIARPGNDNRGDVNVARCVANRFAARRVASDGDSGIVTFAAHLPARM
jgi:hypothetical protein